MQTITVWDGNTGTAIASVLKPEYRVSEANAVFRGNEFVARIELPCTELGVIEGDYKFEVFGADHLFIDPQPDNREFARRIDPMFPEYQNYRQRPVRWSVVLADGVRTFRDEETEQEVRDVISRTVNHTRLASLEYRPYV